MSEPIKPSPRSIEPDQDCTDNPLRIAILGILRQRNTLSEFELIKALEANGVDFPVSSSDANVNLFQRHFLVMNALYQLQRQLGLEGWVLTISALKITLHAAVAGSDGAAVPATEAADAKLAAYYLDWSHYQGMDAKGVEALLNSFWQRFVSDTQLGEALAVLGLNIEANQQDLKRRYRQLAAAHHPDRGGAPDSFVAIRQAYETLRVALPEG